MRVFIFGIGGTGSRVLRSLTMLMASGVVMQNDPAIIPVIIDTDAHNGDTARTRELLRSYHTVRSKFVNRGTNAVQRAFFNTAIRSFNNADEDASSSANLDFQFNFQNQDNTFANFIGYNSLSPQNKDVIELLYNDSLDEHPELHLNLNVGFKGNPNIGCIVFNDLKNSQQFKDLEGSFTQQDRIFIISSIFGGTGSSGFPTLVKLIRSSTNNNLKQAKIGAISVMPYFNVETDTNSAINSAVFDTKTKSALSFYALDSDLRSVNALYYISDNNTGGCLPNVEGGEDQQNNAHLIELIASTSIIDFINKDDNDLSAPTCYEFGAEENGNPFTIAHFNNSTKTNYIEPLVRFAIAAKTATDFVPNLKDQSFYRDLNISGGMGIPNEFNRLNLFFEEFKKWTASEMNSNNNGRMFYSFNFEAPDHINTLIDGKVISTGFLNKGFTSKKLAGKMNSHLAKEQKDIKDPIKYLNILYKTAEETLREMGQLP